MDKLTELLAADMIAQVSISFESTIYSLFSALICTYLIKICYVKYGLAMNNREYFSQSFMLLGITTVIVITIVKYSLALSLGLVGALSIVRFRAAIKEPEELVYLFLIIALGLAFGSNQFAVGFTFTSVAIAVIVVLPIIRPRKDMVRQSNLVVIATGDRQVLRQFSGDIDRILHSSEFSIRELDYEAERGRVVFETNNEIDSANIDHLVSVADEVGLDINLVTGVHVPL